MNYLRQIYYEMKHQKMMTWVSVAGTTLSIFLVMALFMSEQVKTVEVSPESNRHRILIGQSMHVQGPNFGDSSTTGLNIDVAKKIYDGIDGIEKISYIYAFPWSRYINVRGQEGFSVLPMRVDNEFWNIYDFRFIDGKPYDKADVDSEARKVVLTRSIARKLFGEDNVAGREVEVDRVRHVVSGVVEDVNPLLTSSFANIYLPYKPPTPENRYFGDTKVVLLMKEGVTAEDIKKEVESRYNTLAIEAKKTNDEIVYHDQPYTSEEMALGAFGSNNSPAMKSHKKMMWIFYSVLILLPAINLSSMTRSRLRHRVTEIGVRRAFGAKRRSIIGQIFGENLIITLLGGALGLALSMLFILLASHLFFNSAGLDPSSLELVNARPTLGMLFRWQTFLIALLFCLILNILSATVPAWRASRVEPAVAISKSH